jgi:hypothetical protein
VEGFLSGDSNHLGHVGQVGGATLAAAFATLFWPTFVESRGCVLLAERYDEDAFEAWRQSLNGDRRGIEAVVNHVHIWDIFDPDAEGMPGDVLEALVEVLVGGWEAALKDAFPGRHFRVEVVLDDYGPTLTFFSRSG